MLPVSTLQEYHDSRDYSEKPFRSVCYAPHVSLFFDTKGNVLACCQNFKYVLGNVANDRLKDIWQGKKVAVLRKALENDSFAAGCQFCEWQLSVGNYGNAFTTLFDRFPVPTDSPGWPSQMEFSVSNTCNYACIMCSGTFSSTIRSHREKLPPLPKAYGETFFADLREFLPHLRYAKFLGGEPFLAAESLRIWELMIEDGHSVYSHVTTNGSQYNSRVERILERIPMDICVSLDGITKATFEKIRVNSSFETVMENILRFHAHVKERQHDLTFPICLMQQNWHEFGEMLLFADSLDCNTYVNVVRHPPECSLYSLPREALLPIVCSMEQQNDRIVGELKAGEARRLSMQKLKNITIWTDQLTALRRHVDNFDDSSTSRTMI